MHFKNLGPAGPIQKCWLGPRWAQHITPRIVPAGQSVVVKVVNVQQHVVNEVIVTS